MYSLSSKAAARHAISMTMGIGVAVGLFLLMQGLISQRDVSLYLDRSAPIPEFIRLDAPDEVIRERQRNEPEPLEEPEPVPPVEATSIPQEPKPPALSIDPLIPNIRPDLSMADLPVAATPMAQSPEAAQGPVRYTRSLTPVSQVPPRYPRRAQLAGISGWVRLEFIVDVDGSVKDVQVLEASPRRGVFDQEAVRALSRWRFHPQTREGEPVPALATITISFRLDD
ncbi:energy transducer TonB [Desulfonatronospira sp.]|uniref:energy transducer TonB n=1 Tax=Desulfonatronospira sp. TaxID=1962951 RepID=UPI0025C3EFC7|nr:energy transducer TonB [Desulfonatronospira sp.]